jgi:tripartite-type tricarboxylate transporter receptor subunit TctC
MLPHPQFTRHGALRRHFVLAIFTPLLCALALASFAQIYPAKPIRLVVGFSAGGSADISARIFAKRMGELLKTSLVVENRGGAGGSYATQIAADSNADGYTLLWGNVGPLTVNPALGMKLGYNVETDFAPVGLAMTFANALIVRSDFPANSLAAIMALAKEKPGQLNYAMQGVGSAGNLAGELWRALTGIRINAVGYKGAGEIVTSLIGGDVQLAFTSTTAARSMASARIRPIAVTGAKRDPALPNVPTFAEQGVANYDATFWYALLTQAKVPAAVVARLNREMQTVLSEPDIVSSLEAQGLIAAPSSPQVLRETIRADFAKWKSVLAGSR